MKIRTAIVTGVTGLVLSLGLGDAAFAQSDYRYRDRESSRYQRSGRDYRAEQIVRQAYRDILRREPDRSGLRQYTNAMVRDGWSQADVRRSLQRSDEYAQKFGRSRRYPR
jgi:hypothetical protein